MSRTLNEFSVNSPTCNQNELSGLVTKFWFGPIRTDAESIPTLSHWGLIAMAGVLGIVGFMVLRRRKVTA